MLTKYPKTMHLPWSPGLQNDDRVITSLSGFEGQQVIVTEKMDGENTTLYRNHIHARSLDSRHHVSRDWVKAFHGAIKHQIPEYLRICGESMYAQHSVIYDNLESYFLGFGIYTNDTQMCYDWDMTIDLFEMLDITPVSTIFNGLWEDFLHDRENYEEVIRKYGKEGYVVRVERSFHIDEFQQVVAKYVRKDHIQTDQHWMAKPVVPNGLKSV